MSAGIELGLVGTIYRAGAVLAALTSVGFLAFAVARLPIRPIPRLGLSGLQRQRAIEDNTTWRRVEPLVRWSGQRIDALLAAAQRQALDRQIALAGGAGGIVAAELVAISIGCALTGSSLGHLYATLFALPLATVAVGLFGGALLPFVQLDSWAQKRRRRAQLGLPPIIDLLALALSAGLDFPGALRDVVSRSSTPRDPLIEELRLVLHQLEIGKTRSEALWLLAERLPTPNVREFVAAVIQAERHGNPLCEVLATQAVVSRQRRSEQAEETAAKVAAQLFMPLAMAFCCVLVFVFGLLGMGMAKEFRRLL
jgi:tight adherence protein C